MNFLNEEVKIGKNVYINKTAFVVGKVTLGDNVSLWPSAVVRGDENEIIIGENSNVQDNATLHSGSKSKTIIGKGVTVGHNAIAHGATIGDNVIVGMGSIILDKAVVGKDCIIGAGAVISGGKIIPERSIVIGNPYKILRELTDEEVKSIKDNAENYVKLSTEYKNKNI